MSENVWLERVETLSAAYIEKVQELEKNRKFGDGLFGLRPGPADDSCHERFAEELGGLLESCAAVEPDSRTAAEILRYLFTLAPEHEALTCAYWMLLAVHGKGLCLIPRLNPADAEALEALYAGLYPRHTRLPVQRQILKTLKARSGT